MILKFLTILLLVTTLVKADSNITKQEEAKLSITKEMLSDLLNADPIVKSQEEEKLLQTTTELLKTISIRAIGYSKIGANKRVLIVEQESMQPTFYIEGDEIKEGFVILSITDSYTTVVVNSSKSIKLYYSVIKGLVYENL